MRPDIQKVRQYLDSKSTDIKDFLRSLAETESPSRDPRAQQPVFAILKAKCAAIGLDTVHFPGEDSGGYLIARPTGRQKRKPLQLMIGHCDTVWEKGTLENMPVEESDGMMKGPGTFDMKAGLTQMLFALQAIRDLELPLQVTPVCLINSDEEIGSRESTDAIRRLAKIAERAFVLEPPLGLDGKLKTSRKGLARFTLTVKGKAAHAGLNPEDGVSAILELSHQIQQLFALNDPRKGITVNVGMVEGGVLPNVVAPESRAVVDVRVKTMEDASWITKKIFSMKTVHPDTNVTIEGGFGRMPMEKTARNEKLLNAAQHIARQMDVDLQDAAAGGGSDANTTNLYTATLDGLGAPGDGAHAAHEFVFLEKMIERTVLLVFLLLLPSSKSKRPPSKTVALMTEPSKRG